MALSKQMMDFKNELASGDRGRVLRAIKFNAQLASLHEAVPGGYVTALDLAMDAGDAEACKALLAAGAPTNLPVGPRSRFGHIGNTSLSKVLDAPAIAAMPNHREILDVMIAAQRERRAEHASLALLSRLREDAGKIMEKITAAAQRAMVEMKEGPLVPKLVSAIGDKAVTSGLIEIPVAAFTHRLTPTSGMLSFAAIAGGALLSSQGAKMAMRRSRLRRQNGFAGEVAEGFAKKQHEAEETFEKLCDATTDIIEEIVEQARDGQVLIDQDWRDQRYLIDHAAPVDAAEEEPEMELDFPGKSLSMHP